MADKKRGSKNAKTSASARRGAAKPSGTTKSADAKKAGSKKAAAKPVAARGAKAAAKGHAGAKISARKPVPIKKARVGKRAVLPPLPPPPTAPLKSTRSPARRATRAKTPLRSKAAAKMHFTGDVCGCTEAALREKLRLAASYVEIWMARERGEAESEAPSAEAAFVRLWQWLTLEASLNDGRVVTMDLLTAMFDDERSREGN